MSLGIFLNVHCFVHVYEINETDNVSVIKMNVSKLEKYALTMWIPLAMLR